MTTVEICVGDVPSAVVAEDAGADRVELCADLGQGGTTPSLGTVEVALRTLRRAGIRVMVRPRGGDFRVSGTEERVMLADIEAIRGCPTRTVSRSGWWSVPLTADGGLDLAVLRRLIAAAGPLPVTVHKAFDEVDDQHAALEQVIGLGADGGAHLGRGAHRAGRRRADRRAAAAGRRPAAGHRRPAASGPTTSGRCSTETGAREVHLRAPVRRDGREATDGDEVRRLVAATRTR